MGRMCYRCMMPSVEGGICTRCGEPELSPGSNGDNALPPGSTLANGRFLVGKRLGKGGFGVTYIAYDHKHSCRIALKEFMPEYLAVRKGSRIIPKQNCEEQYEKSMNSFMKEARALYELRGHQNIVQVLSTFKENGTAYYTMELLEGESLLDYLKRKKKISADEAFKMLYPVMGAIDYMHRKGILHRDIAPDNIMLCRDRAHPDRVIPKLIDFGAAHVAIQGYSRSYPGVKKSGFSPQEQNWDGKYQGPWSDVYAFCATFYGAIVGTVPVASVDRMESGVDALKKPSELGADISPEMEAVLMKGMKLDYQERTQSMRTLAHDMQQAFNKNEEHTMMSPNYTTVEPERPVGRRIGAWFVEQGLQVLVYFLLIAGLVGSFYLSMNLLGILTGLPVYVYGLPFVVLILDTILLMSVGGTLGQLICGLRVEKDDGSGNPGFGSSIVYSFFYGSYGWLVGVICGLVYLASGKNIGPLERLVGVTIDVRNKPRQAKSSGAVYIQPKSAPVSRPVSRPAVSQPQPQPHSQPHPQQPQKPQPQRMPSQPKKPTVRAALVCMQAAETASDWKGKTVNIEPGITIGKNSTKARLIIPDSTVSGLHCSIQYSSQQGWTIRDENSMNGTYVDNRRLQPMGSAPLRKGSIIRIGKEVLEFHC